MRRIAIVVAWILPLASSAFWAPAAWAGHADKLVVIAKITDVDKEDRGKKGPSRGDEVAFEYDLFDWHLERVGEGSGTCELTKVDRDNHHFEAECEATFDLEDGSIETEGEVSDEDFREGEIVLDISGGTRDFKRAEGKAVIEPLFRNHHRGRDDHRTAGHGREHRGLAKVTFHFE